MYFDQTPELLQGSSRSLTTHLTLTRSDILRHILSLIELRRSLMRGCI